MDTEGGGDALDEHKIVVRRLALLIAAAAVVFALYTLRLIFLQLVHGDEFAARATSTTEYRFNVTAARGDIVDSAGRRIATSTTCYNVELSRLLIGDNDLNETIRSAVEILQANGESWNDTSGSATPTGRGSMPLPARRTAKATRTPSPPSRRPWACSSTPPPTT